MSDIGDQLLGASREIKRLNKKLKKVLEEIEKLKEKCEPERLTKLAWQLAGMTKPKHIAQVLSEYLKGKGK